MLVRPVHLVPLSLVTAGIVWGWGQQPSRGLRASLIVPAPAAVETRAQHPFDARGFYFPTQPLTIKGHRLEWLELSRFHASIQLASPAGDTEPVLIDCGRATITPDTLYVSCAGDLIGSLTMNGAFLDTKGNFRQRPEIHDQATVVLQATVIFKGLSGPQSVLVRFTYSNSGAGG